MTNPTLITTVVYNEPNALEGDNFAFQQNELKLEFHCYDYGARFYDAALARWHVIDPMIEKHFDYTGYAYAYNNPILFIDVMGLDTTIYVMDQASRPQDNGTAGTTYTADITVEVDGAVVGTYSGSSYPNSKSNTDNSTKHNTVAEGEHNYDNQFGHKGSSKKGLNVFDNATTRTTKGVTPDGKSIDMTGENVHSGTSDNGGSMSRGSTGCVTVAPDDVDSFMGNFDWSGSVTKTQTDGTAKTYTGTTGNSSGKIIISRSGASYNQYKAQKSGATYNPIKDTYVKNKF